MKRIITIALVISLVFCFVACDVDERDSKHKGEILSNTLKEQKPLVSGVQVDFIEYVDVNEQPYTFFLFKNKGKFGVMNQYGEIMYDAIYDRLTIDDIRGKAVNGYMEWSDNITSIFLHQDSLGEKTDYEYNGYWLERDGSLTKGCWGGYGSNFWTELYWNKEKNQAEVFCIELGGFVLEKYPYSFEKYMKEEKVQQSFTFVRCINNSDYPANEPFEANLVNEYYGIFDFHTGEMTTSFQYSDYFVINDTLAMVCIDQEWYLVDKQGRRVNDTVYDPMDSNYEFIYRNQGEINGCFVVKSKGKFGLCDANGNVLVEPMWDHISNVSPEGRYWRQEADGTWSLMEIPRV